jgi:choline kinase
VLPGYHYQAVILAAGRGSRIAEESQYKPKALLPIGARSLNDTTQTSFLRRQCDVLKELGVEQIVVVAGYKKEMVIADLAEWGPWVEVVINTTEDISTSGSLHSFQFAANAGLGILDGKRQTLMMDADIVYDKRVLQLLLDAPLTSSMLVCSHYHPGNEEVLVYGKPQRPRFMGKGLSPLVANNEPCIGEAVGIVKFAPQDHPIVRATVDWMVGDPTAKPKSAERKGFGPARMATEHEELTQRFMRYERMSCVTFGEELPFMEVDTPEEYALLRNRFYPNLLALEGNAENTPSTTGQLTKEPRP